jgi:hypothetical protein
MMLNRRETGVWTGESEMTDIIPLTDAACRTLTNAGYAMETHAVPQKYVLGMSKGDFVDADGNQIPGVGDVLLGAVWANQNKDAKVGQFTASDMANFERMVNLYAQQASGLTGLPMRYFGQNTANPPSADGIRADESRLIRSAEMQCTDEGDQWGWVFALSERFRTGAWVDGPHQGRLVRPGDADDLRPGGLGAEAGRLWTAVQAWCVDRAGLVRGTNRSGDAMDDRLRRTTRRLSVWPGR